tara:strand:+ start:864 stop:1691 length:828 start_codon:yes stop_codon:yes gene_type:complete
MAYQKIGIGSLANDGTGDTLRVGAEKINENFEDLFGKINGVANSAVSNGTALTTDSVVLTNATQTLDNKTLTSPTIATQLDMNGGELILDTDADTSITADTDDTIHFKIAGNDRITMSTGLIDIKNDGAQSQIRMYCESSNAHYVALQAPVHNDFANNITVTLPNKTSRIQGTATETITGAGGTNALDIDTEVTFLNTGTASATLTLAAGRFAGQRKIIIMTVAGNNATMTQSNGNLNSTNVPNDIVWNAVGENVTLVYNGSNWNVISVNGVSIT